MLVVVVGSWSRVGGVSSDSRSSSSGNNIGWKYGVQFDYYMVAGASTTVCRVGSVNARRGPTQWSAEFQIPQHLLRLSILRPRLLCAHHHPEMA